jgi:two-component system C4-dicarboxylate transport sensor histidine kinase DctB
LITVALDLDPGPAIIEGNAIQLEQVFINLLTNARDALADAERKEIRVVSRREGARIAIVFADTGCGIADELKSRIFDPFFTTKEVGAGTGLGLSIAYGIVRDHHGAISLANASAEGAAFRIELPLAPADEAAEAAVA